MPIRFIDSWSYGNPLHQAGQFTPFFPACKYINYGSGNFSGNNSVENAPGGAKAFLFGNSGFGQQTLTKVIGSNPTFCIGFLYRCKDALTSASAICRYEAGGITIVNPGGFDNGVNTQTSLMLRQNADGTLSVCMGNGGTSNFPGAVLYTTTYVVLRNAWIYIELSIDTATGTWALYIDDVFIQSQTAVALPAPVDRFSIQSSTFETHNIANLYCTDGERLGPCRANGFPPIIGSTHQWAPLTGTNLSQVKEFGNRPLPLQTPDDNISYVEASAAGVTDYYGFGAPPCYGRVLALALNVDGSAIIGSPSVDFLIKIAGVSYSSGFSDAFPGGYGIQQGITQLNPATGTFWTDTDIAGALFGFSFAGSGTLRVTQFMGEQLVSLRSSPFNCGGGNRSYTS
jgi:hypothetical protein